MSFLNINSLNKQFNEQLILNIITPEYTGAVGEVADEIINLGDVAIKSGTFLFQLRNKNISGKDLYYIAVKLVKYFSLYGCGKNEVIINKPIVIINDRADVAALAGADGVHIGDDDLPLPYIKKIYPQLITGVSVKNPDEAKKAEAEGADYIGAGSVFNTSSKSDAGKPLGADMLTKICDSVKIPVIAIGGINLDNVKTIINTGIKGVAVISAVAGAEDQLDAAKKFNNIKTKNKNKKL
jgi:thiamine-phosphate pyrophosphorylase